MSTVKISELPNLTGRTQEYIIPIVDGLTTYKINVENFMAEPVIDAGQVSGSVSVDLSQGHWYKFELTGNVSVTLSNEREGATYLFWVYSNGNYSVNSMTLSSGGDIYSQGGTLPNPANNAWNLYQGYVINEGMVLTEIDNFSAI